MTDFEQDTVIRLQAALHRAREGMGAAAPPANVADTPLAELLDSMGMVDFLAIVAGVYETTPSQIEECVGREFTTIRELARGLLAAGTRLSPEAVLPGLGAQSGPGHEDRRDHKRTVGCWLGATSVWLPTCYQSAAEINTALGRPAGWLERHAGIRGRFLWSAEDPLVAAADAAKRCLAYANLIPEEVGALLVTSEAPPLLVGLAATLHERIGLSLGAFAIEIGSACTGFLAALRVGQSLLGQIDVVLIVALEAPSHFLKVKPGPPGEAAALFGDAAAACVLCQKPAGSDPIALTDVWLAVDGRDADRLARVECVQGELALKMDGTALAARAVRALAQAAEEVTRRNGLTASRLAGLIIHAGNARMPALVARQLGLPMERVWSETTRTGNLGTVSLPAAWAARQGREAGPWVWAAVGAGMTHGAALVQE
jgi:3-oxoacyl-[acyl-carrier-protein] synthase III